MPGFLERFFMNGICILVNFVRRLFGIMPSLKCWLYLHPLIADSIKWQFTYERSAYDVPETAKKPLRRWTRSEKQDLINAFKDAWKWYHGQSDPLNNLNERMEYPPVNVSETIENDLGKPWVKVDEAYAWDLYIRWIALNLVVEIGNLLSWSISDYTDEELQILFDSAAIMSRSADTTFIVCSGHPEHHNYIKRKDNLGGSLIAPPRYTYAFLEKNDILGATRYDTIANLLQWISDNFEHFYLHSNYRNMEDHWQYRGIPPITRIIEGTTYSVMGTFRHWTAGCHGTTGFLRNVLRAANIPVQLVRICSHGLAYFITEGLYLDHGDNPYNLDFKETGRPASDLLIDEATFESWFGPSMDNHDRNCEYIGHQISFLAEG